MAAADDEQTRPIIIKKVKKGHHAHHSTAWKVAYADFVTAMMAFFLMLWLLSAVDEAKLDGIAEYFTPTVGLRDSMGIGFEGGRKPDVIGTERTDTAPPSVVPGQTPQGPIPDDPKTAPIEATEDAQLFEKAEQEIRQAFEADPNMRDLSDNILIEQSPEGLKIEIADSDKHPMFNPGQTTLTEHGQRIMAKLARLVEQFPNYISITGHTDASPMTSRSPDYTNWELSADRANASRRYLERAGMNLERTKKVVAMADSELLDKARPNAPRNRRIAIILLRGSYLDLRPGQQPAPRELLSPPRPRQQTETPSDAVREQRRREEQQEQEDKTREILRREPILLPGIGNASQAPAEGSNPVDALNTPDAQINRLRPTPNVGATTTTPTPPARERGPEDIAPFVDE